MAMNSKYDHQHCNMPKVFHLKVSKLGKFCQKRHGWFGAVRPFKFI